MLNKRDLGRLISTVNFFILVLALVYSFYLVVNFFSNGQELGNVALEQGYLGIFLFTALLEMSIQLIGPDVLLAAGMLSQLNLVYLVLFLSLGSWVGGLIGYYMGLTNGEFLASIFINKKRFRRGCEFFQRYGNVGMTILALTPLPYFPIVAGIFKMKFKNFLIYALAARTLRWIGLVYIIQLVL